MDDNKIDSLLKSPNPNKFKKQIILTCVFSISFLSIMAYFWWVGDFSLKCKDEEHLYQVFIAMTSCSIGFFVSILASAAYGYILNLISQNKDKTKIDKIKELAEPELTTEILKDLNYYDNKYCIDYEIEAELSQLEDKQNFMIMKVKFQYKKNIKSPDMIFKFVRIRNENDNKHLEDNNKKIRNYLKHEYYSIFDEREFKPDEEGKYYKLNHVYVSSPGFATESLNLECEKKDNIIIYTATMDEQILHNSSFVTIEYEVEYPVEIDSFYYFNFELPTKNANIKFDYKEVQNLINVYSTDFISSYKTPRSLQNLNEPIIRLNYHSWLIPKSSILFIWYKKHTCDIEKQ